MKKPYAIRPVSGQALLNYHNRLAGAEMTLYEADLVEEARPGGQKRMAVADGKNYLLHGDCLSACAWLREQNIVVDLVYIDPPFASGANYAKQIYLRSGAPKNGRTTHETDEENGNGNGIDGGVPVGEEAMYADIWQKEDYLNWIYERLLAIREIMSETGSIYVHLDWHIVYYVKVLMDEVFGEDNFVNDIAWCYTGPRKTGGAFPRKHDNILFYTKSNQHVFNQPYVPHKSGVHTPEGIFGSKGQNNGEGNGLSKEQLEEQGKKLEDWWADIWSTDRYRKEIVDYTTQKPEKLLERIIKASSDKGMVVADFFCGSGTTAKVAHDLDRQVVACDIGVNAIQTTRDRLVKNGVSFNVMKIRDGMRLFRNPAQTEARLFSLITNWKSSDEAELEDFWDGSFPTGDKSVPVKFVGMDKKLTMQYVNTVLEYAGKADAKKVLLIYAARAQGLSQEKVDQAAHDHMRSDVKVEIVSLGELFDANAGQLVAEDSAQLKCKKENNKKRVKIVQFFSPYLRQKIKEYNDARAGTLEKKPGKLVVVGEDGLELIEAVQFGVFAKNGAWRCCVEDTPSAKQKIKNDYLVSTTATHIKIRSVAGDEITIALDALPEKSSKSKPSSAKTQKAPSRKRKKK